MITPVATLLMVVLQGTQRPATQAAQAQLPVQMGYSIEPDTVTVGDPFRLTVRLRAPLGATVEFPAGLDSGAAVEALDPRQEQQGPDTTALEISGIWRLAAWDTGDQPIRLRDVVVRHDGRERRIPLSALTVHVRSVLPADSAQRV